MSLITEWGNSIRLTIDHSYIDADLIDFPISIVLSSDVDENNYSAVDIFDELSNVVLVSGTDVLLLHMDDAGLTDSSPSNHVVTTYGNVAMSSMQHKFGGYSAVFDGNGDYLSIPHSADWIFGTGDFTIDLWINPQASSIYQRLVCRHNGSSGWLLTVNNTNTITYSNANGVTLTSTSTIDVGEWMHIAVVRYGNKWDLYINGSSESTITNSNSSTDLSDTVLQIGRLATQTYYFNGYMDEVRISKGLARWLVNFIPPTGSYESSWANRKKIAISATISGIESQCPVEVEYWDADNGYAYLWTKVPMVYSDTDTLLSLYYSSIHADNITYVGDTGESPATQVWDANFVAVYHMSQNPFIQDILDSTSHSNKAVAQAGLDSDDCVAGKISKAIHFDGSGATDRLNIGDSADFAFNQNNLTIEHIIYPQGDGTIFSNYETTNKVHAPFFDSATSARVLLNGSNYITNIVTTANTFQQFALVRDGNDLKAYINYIQSGNTANVAGVSIGASTKNYIGSSESASHAFTGIVDEFRISNTNRSLAWLKATYYSNWNELITYHGNYVFYGHTQLDGVNTGNYKIYAYRRDNGSFMGSTISSADGSFYLSTTYSGEHFIVALDDAGGISYNDKILGKILPGSHF